MRSPNSPHTTVVPRVEPPVATWGRPLGDLDFSANFGWSQSRAGDVVEKARAREKVGSDLDRPASRLVSSCDGDFEMGGSRTCWPGAGRQGSSKHLDLRTHSDRGIGDDATGADDGSLR